MQATLTTPPLVEYVAVGLGAAGVVGGRVVGGAWAIVAVVGGEAGGIMTPGGGVGDGGAAGTGAVGLAGAGPRPRDGTVVTGPSALAAVVAVVVLAAGDPDASSPTTSW
ncbi:MAG: hypothetical protein M3450_10855 [Actinomycetota bacterium]|nr:hypothetical protein [Actinomycetota bacterium]